MSVYFIADPHGRVKIGFAYDPKNRLRDLQCGSADPLYLLRVIDGSQPVERWLHKRFAALRISGEWFRLTDEMLTVTPPDEIPLSRDLPKAPERSGSIRQYLRNADRLGLLTEEEQLDLAPLLGDGGNL